MTVTAPAIYREQNRIVIQVLHGKARFIFFSLFSVSCIGLLRNSWQESCNNKEKDVFGLKLSLGSQLVLKNLHSHGLQRQALTAVQKICWMSSLRV